MSRLFILAIVNLILAICLSAQAFAGEVTALVGMSKFTQAGDGIWYQEPFPYTLNLRPASIGLRYDSDKSESGLNYSVGYMNLGKVTSSAVAVANDSLSPGDSGYSSVLKRCDGTCWPTSHWYGSGDVQGIYGSAVKHFGPLAVEAGLYLYRPTWSVTIPDYIDCRTCAPHSLTVTHDPRWQIGPMVGVRYAVDKWSLNLSWWRTQVNGDEWIPVFNANTYNLSVGKSF